MKPLAAGASQISNHIQTTVVVKGKQEEINSGLFFLFGSAKIRHSYLSEGALTPKLVGRTSFWIWVDFFYICKMDCPANHREVVK